MFMIVALILSAIFFIILKISQIYILVIIFSQPCLFF